MSLVTHASLKGDPSILEHKEQAGNKQMRSGELLSMYTVLHIGPYARQSDA